MSRRNDDRPTVIALLALAAVLLSLSTWAWTSAPCGMWKWEKAGDVPARCVMHR
ncbi:hypothetical protein EV284_3458 [Streptomyces sp. BK022]|uniref:hypothetical protein n=1 Tax=Streptomyces sp. BK022 TaxID=2512123 RepID=UPI0010E3D9D6|nr:hypothetical protein [Streptomyces sp. BK022]RZU35975.1 hypothetical protein EV284_3458 [Streptomyces sp. BK022]